jgi:hypothetical protein
MYLWLRTRGGECESCAAVDPPRGKLGVSIWVEARLSKYLYGQPPHRLLQDWADQGLEVAQGTLIDRLRRLAPMFARLRKPA